MTQFQFPDYSNAVKIINKKNKQPGDINLKNVNINMSKITELTEYLEEYLRFLSDNNLLPILPAKINIEYVQENTFFHKIYQALKKTYEYPACMNPYNNTLYISNDFKRDSDLESNQYITKARNFFNGSISKALEYAFGHELGHFTLITKNKENTLLPKEDIALFLARNIEESFAEAFSIQIMLIKYPDLIQDTKNLKELLNFRLEKRNNYLEKLNKNTNLNELIESYYFPEIYKNLPFKTHNGNIETNIDTIYNKCYQLALDNNKEVIKDVLNNQTINDLGLSKVFKEKLDNFLNKELLNKYKTTKHLTDDNLVDMFHEKMKSLSFNTKKIKGLREKFLNTQHDTKNKIK